MSLEARLKQGLPNLALPVEVNADFDYVRVTTVARQRERRNVAIACLLGAAGAALVLLVGPQVTDLVTSMDLDRPLPPAEENVDDERSERTLPDRPYGEEPLRRDNVSRLHSTVTAGLTATSGRAANDIRTPGASQASGSSGGKQQEGVTGAGAPVTRTATGAYTGAAVPAAGGTSSCDRTTSGAACVRFETEPGERSVMVSISDAAGGPVFAAVQIDRDDDGQSDGEWTYLCNETVRPVPVPSDGRAVVYVEIYRGTCTDGSGARSNPLRGTVTAMFAS